MKRKQETPKRKVNKSQKRLRHAPSPPPNNQIASQFERFQQMQMQQFQQFLESQKPTPCPSAENPSPIVFADSSVTNSSSQDARSSENDSPSESHQPSQTVTNPSPTVNNRHQSVINIDVSPVYSNLDDIMTQSDNESSDNQDNQESSDNPATPPPERSRSARPGTSKNYFETPITPKERTAAASTFSPTSPSLLEYKKKDAVLHKNRLTKGQITNLTLNVMDNYIWAQGRKKGARKTKQKKKRQGFKTPSKSKLIKHYYKLFFPDLYYDWGHDFEAICPIKPADVNQWYQNLFKYGSVDQGRERSHLPDPPNFEDLEREDL